MFLWVYILGQIKAVFDKHLFADLLLRFQRVLLRVHLSQGVAWAKSSLSLQGVRLVVRRLANNNIKKDRLPLLEIGLYVLYKAIVRKIHGNVRMMVLSSENNLSRFYFSLMVIDANKVNAFGGCGNLFA